MRTLPARTPRTALTLLLVSALVTAAAGCGSDREDNDAQAAAAIVAHKAAVDAARGNATPHIAGRKLLEIRRLGQFFGTSDVATYGRDGSVVVIRAYGGGGYYALTCHLSRRELRAVKRDTARLPLGRAPHVRERPRKSFYQPPAPTYTIEHGRYVGSFTVDAIPPHGRAMKRHLERILKGREGRCRTTFATRTR